MNVLSGEDAQRIIAALDGGIPIPADLRERLTTLAIHYEQRRQARETDIRNSHYS